MLRFLLLGAIISTAAVNAILIESSSCVGKCAPSSTSNQYLPHQQCDKYCVCVSGQPEVSNCYFNNHWSREYEICTHPAEAKCHTSSNTTISSNALDQGCRTKCPQNESAILAHNDCEKYCWCSNNSVTVFTCPNGHFSVKSNSCVPVADAGCITRPNTARVPIKPNTTSTTTDNECIGSCPELEHPSHTVYLAHRNCSKYCHCKNNHPIIKNCLPHFLFSLKDMRCRQSQDVDCNQVNSTTTIIIPPSDKAIKRGCQTQCPRYNALIPHKERSKFCLCRNGKIFILRCPRPYYFSTDYARCICTENSQRTDPTKLFYPPTTTKIFSSTSLLLSTEPIPSSTEPSPPITTGIIEEFNNCVESCPDSNSYYYEGYYNISHKECNKYCECYKGNIMKVISCSADHNFDRFFRKCDFLVFVTCYDDDISTSARLLSTPLSSSTEPSPPITTGIIEEFNNCAESCPDSNSDYYEYYYNISHKDCNKYCECYKGNIMKVISCSADDNFDRFFRICDLKNFAECYGSDKFTLATTLLSTSSTELPLFAQPTDDVSNCIGNCTEIAFKNYDTVVNLPHENCNKYCECYRGEIKVKECPLTHQFDWIHRECLISANASCLNHTFSVASSPLSVSSSENPFITASPEFENDGDCIESCPGIDSVNYDEYVKIPHQNCKKYCECHRGILTVIDCPFNSYYDCYFQTCDVYKYATCYNQYASSAGPIQSDPSAASPEITENCIGKCSEVSKMNYAIFLKHKQCQKFCECFNGRLTVKSCPVNSYFNSNLGLCDQAKYVECPDTNETSVSSPMSLPDTSDCIGVCVSDDVYLLSHKHCAKYCECDLGFLNIKSCPSGTYFNGYTKRCEDTEFDDCTKIPEASITILSEYIEGCAEDCPPFVDDNHVDFVPHKQCEKYCLCGIWEKPLVMSCGPNTHFNPTSKKCDYIENAGCKGITSINSTFTPHVVLMPTANCSNCYDKTKLYTILLKISGIKNGSEIDLTIGDPENTVSISNGDDNDENNSGEIFTGLKKDINEERRFPKDPNGLVTVLANLSERAQCIGQCPEPYLNLITVYLRHRNCRRACKCTRTGFSVMECHNNYYWNPETEMCDPVIYTGCTEVVDDYKDESREKNSPFAEFKKFMGW